VVLQEILRPGAGKTRHTVVLALSAGQKTAEVPVTNNMSQQQARIVIETPGSRWGMSANSSRTLPVDSVIADIAGCRHAMQLPGT